MTLVAFAVENANVADVAVVGLAGLESMVTEGLALVLPLPLLGAVIVHEARAWFEPAVLATRMLKACEPSESPVSVTGDVQATAVVLSVEHVVVVAPEDVQLMVAEVADVLAGGCAVSVTVGTTCGQRCGGREAGDCAGEEQKCDGRGEEAAGGHGDQLRTLRAMCGARPVHRATQVLVFSSGNAETPTGTRRSRKRKAVPAPFGVLGARIQRVAAVTHLESR